MWHCFARNGDPVCDNLCTNNWLLVGYAWRLLHATGDPACLPSAGIKPPHTSALPRYIARRPAISTAAGHARFDVSRNENIRHAARYWKVALLHGNRLDNRRDNHGLSAAQAA